MPCQHESFQYDVHECICTLRSGRLRDESKLKFSVTSSTSRMIAEPYKVISRISLSRS